MAGWREIKAKARAAIHETFEYPAVYLPATGSANMAVRVDVRKHTKIAPRENEFTWPATSGLLEMTPKIVFKSSQVARVRDRSLVIFSADEMYRLGAAQPDREGYIAVEASQVSAEEAAAISASLAAVTGQTWEGILP